VVTALTTSRCSWRNKRFVKLLYTKIEKQIKMSAVPIAVPSAHFHFNDQRFFGRGVVTVVVAVGSDITSESRNLSHERFGYNSFHQDDQSCSVSTGYRHRPR